MINNLFLKNSELQTALKKVQAFANKACILKAKDEIQGVVLKGVDNDYDWTFFRNKIIEGRAPVFGSTLSNEVIISKNLAKKTSTEIE